MANALDILPLQFLQVSSEIKEQIHLTYSQLRRIHKPQVDPTITALRDCILSVIQEDINKIDVTEMHHIFTSLHLSTYAICNQELELLTAEMHTQAGTGGIPAVCTIKNLARFVKHAQCVLYSGAFSHIDMDCPRISCAFCPENFFTSSPTSTLSAAEGPVIPDEFRCPISLDLMQDPVVIASGHTFDRAAISKWIDNGHRTCPKSGQRLLHVMFIPNNVLRRMIQRWCDDNCIPYDKTEGSCSHEDVEEDHILSREEALATMKETVAYLIGKLATGSLDIQRHVTCELRLLTKCGIENRICIAEAGAIPFLVPLLTSPDERTQENAVTAMLNLSICENNKSLIMAAGALDAVVEVLSLGATMTTRENAAATLFSLSMVNDYKLAIGEKSGAIAALVELLKEGTSRGKKDAATALFHLCIFGGNKPKVVNAGAVPVLLQLLSDDRACITDDALSVLALLVESQGGCSAINVGKAMPVLVELSRFGSAKGKENSVAVMLALCKHGGKHVISSLARMDMALPALRAISELGTSARAKRKASSLLKLLHNQLLVSH
ncbi:hypothetical protein L7F22_068463 [Adiantum nelumboides]|nr:hypothetical protein [Adiantum nelumboides]